MRDKLEEKCREVVDKCRFLARDGSAMFAPDGVGYYTKLWTRDFCYLVQEGWSFLEPQEARRGIEMLIEAQRSDGALPDNLSKDFVAFYRPGTEERPCGAGPTLDNSLFMVSVVYHYWRQSGDSTFMEACLPALESGMQWVPRLHGLVFNDPQAPSSTYGFQDTVAMSGHVLFCSLLWIQSCRQLTEMATAVSFRSLEDWGAFAELANRQLRLLWDSESGGFFAADHACRQVDIWGTAFLVSMELGDAEQREQAARFLADNFECYAWNGQIAHLLQGETWESTFIPVEKGTYQNGGYWATPSLWVASALEKAAPEKATTLLDSLARFYLNEGIYEWSSPDGKRGPDLYVASIFNARRVLSSTAR